MALFSKKQAEESGPKSEPPPAPEEKKEEPASGGGGGGDASVGQIAADLEKLKAQFSSFYELSKASNERFTRVNEQIGELRSMLLERDRANQKLEAKATQAVDLVQSVQPDKLMVDMRKTDTKVEALRATIESNETVMQNIVSELKEMRNRLNTFKGMEQVVKLSEDTKQELMTIKQVSATVERHADKVETMFSEVNKSFGDFKRFQGVTEGLDKDFKQVSNEFESMKAKVPSFASKKEVETLLGKFSDFEKKAGNVLDIMNKRFTEMEKENDRMLKQKLERLDQLLKGFETLAAKTPDLDKYFNLLTEEAKKAAKADVEKVKKPGEEEEVKAPEGGGGIGGKLKGMIPGKGGGDAGGSGEGAKPAEAKEG